MKMKSAAILPVCHNKVKLVDAQRSYFNIKGL